MLLITTKLVSGSRNELSGVGVSVAVVEGAVVALENINSVVETMLV